MILFYGARGSDSNDRVHARFIAVSGCVLGWFWWIPCYLVTLRAKAHTKYVKGNVTEEPVVLTTSWWFKTFPNISSSLGIVVKKNMKTPKLKFTYPKWGITSNFLPPFYWDFSKIFKPPQWSWSSQGVVVVVFPLHRLHGLLGPVVVPATPASPGQRALWPYRFQRRRFFFLV